MRDNKVRVAVVTGIHPFDVQGFQELFESMPSIKAHIQHIDNFAATPDSIGLAKDNPFHPDKVRKEYDVVLFFTMLLEAPRDEDVPWYVGRPRSAIEELGDSGQGIFVMHHAVIQTPQWPVWHEIVGIEDLRFEWKMDEKIRVQIANPDHPITRGMKPFEIIDESYKMADASAGSDILLTTDNPNSARIVAWARQHKKSRVFCTILGHDNLVWSHPSFRKLVERAILWCARRL